MRQYISLLNEVLNNGISKDDRTGIGTISKFGTQRIYNLNEGFPLLTTKKVHFKSIVVELLWFIAGDTNIKYLVDNNVRIWNEWPYEKFKKSKDFKGETMEQFVAMIKESKEFAKKYGDLGPVYGAQWRNFNNQGVDQLSEVINLLKTNPNSRRIIISAWNPVKISEMALPPCHSFMQFYVVNKKLSCQMYQRSADVFLGVPFNIASYALLTHMLAQVCDLEVGEFVHTTGDTHIYLNHLEQVNEQIKREPKKLPKLILNSDIKNIFNFKIDDIKLVDYDCHPAIKAEVAV